MNTSKQVNVMLGLLFLVVVALGLYFLWDINIREENAAEKQVRTNAERGAFLFARNCRICHGVQGQGTLENPNLPGLPLNLDGNRPVDPDTGLPDEIGIREIQARFTDTIVCGRVGTVMPPWRIDQGGPLNDFQIEQLVALITGATSEIVPTNPDAVSREAWEKAVELAEEADVIDKFLEEGVSESDTVLSLNDVEGLAADTFLRIEDEVLNIVAVPPSSELSDPALEIDTVLIVKDASGFQPGMVIAVADERMRIVSVSGNEIGVERAFDDTKAVYHPPRSAVSGTSTDITVERGAFSTAAVQHAAGTEVFAGPIAPPEGPVTGAEGAFVCGQTAQAAPAPAGPPAPTPSPGQAERPATAQQVQGEFIEPTDSLIGTETEDNFFVINNFKAAVGEEVTIRVANTGQAFHNLRIAGLDGEWNSEDDFVAGPGPQFIQAGETAELTFRLDQEATLVFRCDVHPTLMWGQITVTSQ